MAGTDLAPEAFTPQQRRLAIGLVAMVTILATENLSVATILPVVERDLGDLRLYGWVGAGFTLAQLVGVVIGGRWSDRVNPVVPMHVGIACFVAGLVAATAAPTMTVLVAARVLQGLGAGIAPSTAYVCIGRGYRELQRPKMFALLSTAWIVPSLGGPALASIVAEHAGWRWVFAGLLPFTVLASLAVFGPVRSLGDPPAVGQTDSEPTTALAFVLAVGAGLVLAGLGARSPAWGAAAVIAGLAVGVPAFRRLTPKGTLSAAPGMPAACAVKGLLTFAFFSADFYLSLALVNGRGRSTFYAGTVLMVSSFTWTGAAWIQTRLVAPWGYRRLVMIGLVCVACGVGITSTILWESMPVWMAFIGAAVAGFGIGFSYSPLSQVVLVDADDDSYGIATSAVQLCDVLGVSLGVGMGGAVVAAGDRMGWSTTSTIGIIWTTSIAVALLALFPAWRLRSSVRFTAL